MYFNVFTGVFELYGAAGFTNSIIVLHILLITVNTSIWKAGTKYRMHQVGHLVMSWQQVFYMFL